MGGAAVAVGDEADTDAHVDADEDAGEDADTDVEVEEEKEEQELFDDELSSTDEVRGCSLCSGIEVSCLAGDV